MVQKLGIYDPYLHIMGGAEKYVAAIAATYPDAEITLFTDNKNAAAEIERKFGIQLHKVNTTSWPTSRNLRTKTLKKFDLFIYVTDGSLFWASAKKNILIIQTPVHIPNISISNRLKLLSWNTTLCYSQYMAFYIRRRLKIEPQVVFVPIDVSQKNTTNKKDVIVSIGRFFPNLHNKKQIELVHAFKKLLNYSQKRVELLLIGSVDPGGEDYAKRVKKEAAGLPITILNNISHVELETILSTASLYWHATGFGEDFRLHPERAEHFGVVTLEAMAHGCVPVVFSGGGQPELIDHGKNGYLWHTLDELVSYSLELLRNKVKMSSFSKQAREESQKYSLERFKEKIYESIKK